MVRPADFPAPVDHREFLSEPTAPEEERIEVGVLFVGGGPAGLAGAIRLGQLLEKAPEVAARLGEVPVALVEKGKTVGSHLLSGAVVRPQVLRELFPDTPLEALPSYGEVRKEGVYVLTSKHAQRIPTPPPFHNKGNHVFSLSRLGRFMAEKAEELGVMLLPETNADKLLVRDDAVQGVLTGAKGLDREGQPGSTYEPGAELLAQATVLADGVSGHLTPAAIDAWKLHGADPQIYALGVKEVWKVARPLDKIIHTMGWPLRTGSSWREFGGSFIYPMGDEHICIGLVVGLDYRDASMSVHDLLQQFKLHPFVAKLIDGGERVSWGAKAIPEGGFFSMPASLSIPGAVFAGDCAGMVNVPKLKGVHYAMRAGMLAADTIFEALQAGVDPRQPGALDAYTRRVIDSEIMTDLYAVRNMRQAFHDGFFVGGAVAGLMDATKGRFRGLGARNVHDSEQTLIDSGRTFPAPDGKRTFDKLSSVFASGNRSRDDQPNHIRIARRVDPLVAKAWVNMCPAAVYELHDENAGPDGLVDLTITPSNCVQCGAINAKGGRLTAPEGGSGPEYTLM